MGSIDSGIRDVRAGRLASSEYSEVFSDLHPPLSRHEAFVQSATVATSATMRLA